MIPDNNVAGPSQPLKHLLGLRVVVLLDLLVVREGSHRRRLLEELKAMLVEGVLLLLSTDVLDLDLIRLFSEVLIRQALCS